MKRAKKTQQAPILLLPRDVLVLVFKRVSGDDVLALACTCKSFSKVAEVAWCMRPEQNRATHLHNRRRQKFGHCEMMELPPYDTPKVVLGGSNGSGKTTLRFWMADQNEQLSSEYIPTVADTMVVRGGYAIVDTSSHPDDGCYRYEPVWYSKAAIILLCISLHWGNLENLPRFHDLAKKFSPSAPVILLGLQSDRAERKISAGELRDYQLHIGAIGVVEMSCRVDKNEDNHPLWQLINRALDNTDIKEKSSCLLF